MFVRCHAALFLLLLLLLLGRHRCLLLFGAFLGCLLHLGLGLCVRLPHGLRCPQLGRLLGLHALHLGFFQLALQRAQLILQLGLLLLIDQGLSELGPLQRTAHHRLQRDGGQPGASQPTTVHQHPPSRLDQRRLEVATQPLDRRCGIQDSVPALHAHGRLMDPPIHRSTRSHPEYRLRPQRRVLDLAIMRLLHEPSHMLLYPLGPHAQEFQSLPLQILQRTGAEVRTSLSNDESFHDLAIFRTRFFQVL
mmetsp:Transcript_28463/g.80146  ORF Transcript_28463/g.80146 Transcript_28463/m.80146 type:complete len:249 (-) Transcript_28463:617-1363(-)